MISQTDRDITIIGAGIVGLSAASFLTHIDPTIQIRIIDAGPPPGCEHAQSISRATLGAGSDARQFTGSEGLALQNPVHSSAVFLPVDNDQNLPGWQTMIDATLPNEDTWRDELKGLYHSVRDEEINPYDVLHTTLNYGGIEGWEIACRILPQLNECRITKDILVFFESESELDADFSMESGFNPYDTEVQRFNASDIPQELESFVRCEHIAGFLKVAGSSWRIKSVAEKLLHKLSINPQVTFEWERIVSENAFFSNSSRSVWAISSGSPLPPQISAVNRVQGIGGFWITLPNRGLTHSFKIRAPQPSGYINFTPDGDSIHISGGFGWIGERSFSDAEELLKPTKKHFVRHLSHFIRMSGEEICKYPIRICVRPSTPSGLPDIYELNIEGHTALSLSGSCKAGATQAMLLALFAAQRNGLEQEVAMILEQHGKNRELVSRALNSLENLRVETAFGLSTT